MKYFKYFLVFAVIVLACVAVVHFWLFGGIAEADEGDDTLKYYLSKSDLVVVGIISSDSFARTEELGVANYICDFQIDWVIKGNFHLQKENIRVNIMRFEAQV